jgi:hypothetical protein
MSLPSWAIFYNDGVEVCYSFINCGWFYRDTIPFLQNLLNKLKYPDCDWTELVMYDTKYTKELVIFILTYIEEVKS